MHEIVDRLGIFNSGLNLIRLANILSTFKQEDPESPVRGTDGSTAGAWTVNVSTAWPSTGSSGGAWSGNGNTSGTWSGTGSSDRLWSAFSCGEADPSASLSTTFFRLLLMMF